jgi:hypothetical protein
MSSLALRGFGAALVASFTLAFLSGCGAAIGEAAGAVPGPVIEGSLDELDNPETQRQIADVLSSPAYRDATDELLGNLTDGTLDALSDEERRARIAELTDHFVAKMGESLGQTMRRDFAPAIATIVARTMDESIEHALSEENQARLAAMIAAIAREAVAALATAVREELAPAVSELLRDEEVKGAVGEVTRQVARDIVLGLEDGFQEIERRDERGHRPETVLTRLQDFANEGVGWMQVGLVALVLLATALAVAWIFAHRRGRTAQAEAARRELALVAMLEAMKSAEGTAWAPELRALLKKTFRDNEHAEYLRELLRKNRHLRLEDAIARANGRDDHGDGNGAILTPPPERERPSHDRFHR